MKFFEPLTIQPPFFRTAVERVPEASEPALGSVSPHAPRCFPLAKRHQVFLFLRFSAKLIDMVCTERIVRRNRNPDRAINARKLFNDRGILNIAHAGAAILFRKKNSGQSQLGEFWLTVRSGKCCASSHSITCGAISASANSRTLIFDLLLFFG